MNYKYATINGFTGMKRDIILRLIDIVKNGEKIRMIVGMNNEYYHWKNHNCVIL